MSRNGAGLYTRAVSAYVYGMIIDQVVVNSEMDDIATALTASIAKDGQTTPTANLPMGGFKLTGLGAATTAGEAIRYEQVGTLVQAYDADLTTWAGITPGANVAAFLATPTSANLAAALTNETGSGAAVFATQPSFASTLGVGAATASASGAGITFPATQSASTDANTLDDYEEGTWTPTQGAGLTVVGAFSSAGTYTKVGRLVTILGSVSGATSVAAAAGNTLCGGLPFSASTTSPNAAAINSVLTSSSIIFASGTTLASIDAVSVAGTIFFGATYTV